MAGCGAGCSGAVGPRPEPRSGPSRAAGLGAQPHVSAAAACSRGASGPAVTHPGETENHPAVLTAYRAGDINSRRNLTRRPPPPSGGRAGLRPGPGLGVPPSPCGTQSRRPCCLRKRGVGAELYPSSALQLLSRTSKGRSRGGPGSPAASQPDLRSHAGRQPPAHSPPPPHTPPTSRASARPAAGRISPGHVPPLETERTSAPTSVFRGARGRGRQCAGMTRRAPFAAACPADRRQDPPPAGALRLALLRPSLCALWSRTPASPCVPPRPLARPCTEHSLGGGLHLMVKLD